MVELPFEQIRWADGKTGIVILDQTRLPEALVEKTLVDVDHIEEAIVSLRVRGAPLIGITAAMGLAALVNGLASTPPTSTWFGSGPSSGRAGWRWPGRRPSTSPGR